MILVRKMNRYYDVRHVQFAVQIEHTQRKLPQIYKRKRDCKAIWKTEKFRMLSRNVKK